MEIKAGSLIRFVLYGLLPFVFDPHRETILIVRSLSTFENDMRMGQPTRGRMPWNDHEVN